MRQPGTRSTPSRTPVTVGMQSRAVHSTHHQQAASLLRQGGVTDPLAAGRLHAAGVF